MKRYSHTAHKFTSLSAMY